MSDKKGVRIELPADVMRVTFHPPEIIAHNYVPPPDDHPIYQLVGRVTIAWGHYEHELDRIISTLSGVNSARIACLTAQMMGAGPRLTSIIAQLNLRKMIEPEFEKYEAKIKALMNTTFNIQEHRNRVVHDAWYIDTNRDKPGQFRRWPRAKLEFGITPVDKAEIEKTVADIKTKLVARAKELFTEINADVAASLKRRGEEEERDLRERLLENQKPKKR